MAWKNLALASTFPKLAAALAAGQEMHLPRFDVQGGDEAHLPAVSSASMLKTYTAVSIEPVVHRGPNEFRG